MDERESNQSSDGVMSWASAIFFSSRKHDGRRIQRVVQTFVVVHTRASVALQLCAGSASVAVVIMKRKQRYRKCGVSSQQPRGLMRIACCVTQDQSRLVKVFGGRCSWSSGDRWTHESRKQSSRKISRPILWRQADFCRVLLASAQLPVRRKSPLFVPTLVEAGSRRPVH